MLVMQFLKVHDIRKYNNHDLQMLERIECSRYSAHIPRIHGQITSSVEAKLNSFLLKSLIIASFLQINLLMEFTDKIYILEQH